MILLATLAAAAAIADATPAPWTHSVPVAHGGVQATATYEARARVSTREIGTAAGTRMSTLRCVWTAEIATERRLSQAGSATESRRALASTKTFKGQRPGYCAHARPDIDQEIASKSSEIDAHLLAVSTQDQHELRAEVETLTVPRG